MVRQRAKAIKKVEDTSWVPRAVEICRDLTSLGATLTVENYAAVSIIANKDLEVAEQRLRKLTQLGWLHMAAARDKDGKFLHYFWTVR